jgi:hypothetical protein
MVAIRYIQLDWWTHSVAVIIQEPAPVRQMSSNSPSARMSFSQVQRVLIVEHCLASRFYINCQTHFSILLCHTNPNYLDWWTVSVTQGLFAGLHQTWGKQWVHASLNAVDISDAWCKIALVFWFKRNLFFDRENMPQEWVARHFDHPV